MVEAIGGIIMSGMGYEESDDIANIGLETMIADVRRCWDESRTPDELQKEFETWTELHQSQVDTLYALIAATVAWWVTSGAEQGHALDTLEQIALQATQRAISVLAKSMKERQGKPYEPARIAIVGYVISQAVADTGAVADLDGLSRVAKNIASNTEAENAALRALVFDIIEGNISQDAISPRFQEITGLRENES